MKACTRIQSASPMIYFPSSKKEHLVLALEDTKETVLLVLGLEASVTELRAGVDELEADFLEGRALGVNEAALTEGQDALLGSNNASLEHEPILIDNTIVGKSTHGCDGLEGKIRLSGGVVLVSSVANAIDLRCACS